MSLYPAKYLEEASDFLAQHSLDFTDQEILITGGSGFVGSWVIDLLRHYTQINSQTVKIVGLSRDLKTTFKKIGSENFRYVEWIEGGIEKIKSDDFYFTHALHAATPTTKKTGSFNSENVKFSSEYGMRYLIERAKINGNMPRILHTSSGAVYGKGNNTLAFILFESFSSNSYLR
jgi:dTDP-glucose 4,6-dehydratase